MKGDMKEGGRIILVGRDKKGGISDTFQNFRHTGEGLFHVCPMFKEFIFLDV